MFILFLFVLLFYGLDALLFLIFKTPYIFTEHIMYLIVGIFGILNYILVFKNNEFLQYTSKRLNPILTFIVIIAIFAGGLGLILYVGPRNISGHVLSSSQLSRQDFIA
ncbi:hypothetical protein A9P82_13970 [Arachidicoccus ginsenosidimutans]|nr:hypothetical protein A9P82_13970 [Arachidicoccus sp. BS20]